MKQRKKPLHYTNKQNCVGLKLKIFKIIDERVLFYSNNPDLLPPKPKLSFRYLEQDIKNFIGSKFWLQLIKLLIMLLLCDDFIISIL